jgi:hypothetical protein
MLTSMSQHQLIDLRKALMTGHELRHADNRAVVTNSKTSK